MFEIKGTAYNQETMQKLIQQHSNQKHKKLHSCEHFVKSNGNSVSPKKTYSISFKPSETPFEKKATR